MPSKLTSPFHQILCLILLLYLLVNNVNAGHVTEFLVDSEIPPSAVIDSTYDVQQGADTTSEKLCHVEYQVIKRILGKCVKLGRNLKGCASGNYIQPLHPECMTLP